MAQNFILEKIAQSKIRGFLWKVWYQRLGKTYQKIDWKFMNYGYAPLDGPPEMIPLEAADAEERYSLQLYHHVASAVDLSGLDVLEVGSGRGGGADYIMRYLKPKSMVGVDFAKNAVEFCSRNYKVDGLSFKVGNAEALPFEDNRFDAVLNVESSHCYTSVETFLSEVKRVLRQGGYFLFADIRTKDRYGLLQEQLSRSGLQMIKKTDISHNVVRSLHLDSERKLNAINQTIKKSAIDKFAKFAGVESSPIYRMLRDGGTIYTSYVLQKN